MIHLLMALPWAVEPDEARLPVAQVKPAPSNVVAVPPPAPLDPVPSELPPAELVSDIAALEDSLEAAEVAALVVPAAGVVVVAVLLSDPQAAIVRAPARTRAARPVVRAIFTQFLQDVRPGDARSPGGPAIGCRSVPDVRGAEWTDGPWKVNGM